LKFLLTTTVNRFMGAVIGETKENSIRQTAILSALCFTVVAGQVGAQQMRGAFPSPSIQILPMMVAAEREFYKREGLELELVFVRGATTAVQALLANQIQFIFSIGPQMPAVWEGNDIMLLAQQAVAGHRIEHETQKETCRIHGSPFRQRSDGRAGAEVKVRLSGYQTHRQTV
jgi:hypothetical protein